MQVSLLRRARKLSFLLGYGFDCQRLSFQSDCFDAFAVCVSCGNVGECFFPPMDHTKEII